MVFDDLACRAERRRAAPDLAKREGMEPAARAPELVDCGCGLHRRGLIRSDRIAGLLRPGLAIAGDDAVAQRIEHGRQRAGVVRQVDDAAASIVGQRRHDDGDRLPVDQVDDAPSMIAAMMASALCSGFASGMVGVLLLDELDRL